MQAQPGEDYTRMTPEQEGEGHHKKSVVGKVKNKAKKLTSKIKGVTKKKKDPHGNEVDHTSSSSSEGEEESSPQDQQTGPFSTDRAVHGGGYKNEPNVDQTSRDLGGLKLGETHGAEDPSAPPAGAGWGAKFDEPRAATDVTPFSEESHKRQQELPSALGQESAGAGLTSGLGHGLGHDLGHGNQGTVSDPASVEAGSPFDDSDVKIPEGIMKPKDDRLKPVDDGVDSSGRDMLSSKFVGSGQPEELSRPSESYEDKPLSEKTGEGAKDAAAGIAGGLGAGGLAAGVEHSAKEGESPKSTDPQQQKGWMQRATEGVTSVKNVITSKLASPRASEQTAPTFDKAPEDKTYTESARDTAIGAKDEAGHKVDSTTTSAAETGRSWTDQAKLAALSVKDAVSSKLPSSTSPKDVPVEGIQPETGAPASKPITTRAMETATGVKDTVAAKLGYGATPDSTAATGGTALHPQHEQTPGTGGPTVTQKVMGTVTGAKDTLASKLGYGGSGTGTTGSGTGTTGTTEGAPPSSKMFTPDEHDTALSQKITDMLTLKSGSTPSATTPSTTTPSTTTPSTTPTSTDETQGKGYMDRVTGAVGSLLGGKKTTEDKPATGTTDPHPVA